MWRKPGLLARVLLTVGLLVVVVEKVGNLDVFQALEATGIAAFTRFEACTHSGR